MDSVSQRQRSRGQRREGTHKSLIGSTVGVHPAHVGENRVNMQQMHALDHLFCTHPAVQAARTVLHGQLLSGGLQVTRGGKVVELKPSFKAHLQDCWLPFARDVIDCFLKFGLAVFSFEYEQKDKTRHAVKRLRGEVGSGLGGRKGTGDDNKTYDNVIPIVPPLGTYDIAFNTVGRAGYVREYLVYSQAPGMSSEPDESAFVHVRQAPDGNGNVNSPVASVFELGSFVSAMTDLAYVAEVSRSTPQVTTQMRKPDKNTQLDAGALFFDSESRAVAAGQGSEESHAAARMLEMQASLCKLINDAQTVNHGRDGVDPLRRDAQNSGMRAPPQYPPKLFVLPRVRCCPVHQHTHTHAHPSLSPFPLSSSAVRRHRTKK